MDDASEAESGLRLAVSQERASVASDPKYGFPAPTARIGAAKLWRRQEVEIWRARHPRRRTDPEGDLRRDARAPLSARESGAPYPTAPAPDVLRAGPCAWDLSVHRAAYVARAATRKGSRGAAGPDVRPRPPCAHFVAWLTNTAANATAATVTARSISTSPRLLPWYAGSGPDGTEIPSLRPLHCAHSLRLLSPEPRTSSARRLAG